jgi:MFS family permease
VLSSSETKAGKGDPRPRWDDPGLRWTLLVVSSFSVMANATIAASMPRMAEVFSDTPDAEFLSKLILTTPALFIVIFAPIAGYCIDRWGRLKFLFASLALYGAAGSSGFYLESLHQMLAGRALLGVAVAGIMTTTTTLLGDYFSGSDRLRFAGLQGMFFSMAGMVFVGAGGILAEFGWRLPFLVYLCSWAALVPAIIFLREPTRHARGAGEGPRELAPVSALALAYGLTFFMLVVFYMTPVQLPFLLRTIGVESSGLAALAIALGSLASGGGALIQHRVHYRVGFVSIYSIAMLFIVAGYGVIAIAENYAAVLWGAAISGFGAGVLFPNAAMWVTTLAPAHLRGRLLGGMTASMYLGQFFSPILVQPVVKVAGLSGAFGVFAGVSLFVSLVLWVSARGFDRHAARIQ